VGDGFLATVFLQGQEASKVEWMEPISIICIIFMGTGLAGMGLGVLVRERRLENVASIFFSASIISHHIVCREK